MTDDLLLDTHVVLWLANGDTRLRPSTSGLIEKCRRDGGTVWFSAISVWEIAQLADARRLVLDRPVRAWVERLLDHAGVAILPLGWHAAMGAYQLRSLAHRDPADRLLIATAIERACPLVTYDERIIRFATDHGAEHGFTVQA